MTSPNTSIAYLQAELELLRAWKAEIERQEPVAWMKRNHSDDGWVLVKDISLMLPHYRTGYKPLFAAPVVSPLSSTSETDVEKLKAKIAELESLRAENAQLKNNHATEVRRARILKERTDLTIQRIDAYDKWAYSEITPLRQQLAESQAREARLREALEEFLRNPAGDHTEEIAEEALSLPHDDTALKEYRDVVIEECAKVCENSDRYRGDYFAIKVRELKNKE